MKKLGYIMLMVVLLIPMLIIPTDVRASRKTLKDLYNELLKLERDLEKINNDKTLTETQINQIKQNIKSIDREVIIIEKTVEDIHQEINK